MNEEKFNLEIRKFLKVVGINSQRDIERAVRDAAEAGKLGDGPVKARMTLELPELGVRRVIEEEIALK
ncbi:MAG: DUF6494 family protein [Gammaproteobacteria bacterium]